MGLGFHRSLKNPLGSLLRNVRRTATSCQVSTDAADQQNPKFFSSCLTVLPFSTHRPPFLFASCSNEPIVFE
jgi:hypothetical protein